MISLPDLERFKGSVSPDEAKMLSTLAYRSEGKAIVEIGSWQGKSALALAMCQAESEIGKIVALRINA